VPVAAHGGPPWQSDAALRANGDESGADARAIPLREEGAPPSPEVAAPEALSLRISPPGRVGAAGLRDLLDKTRPPTQSASAHDAPLARTGVDTQQFSLPLSDTALRGAAGSSPPLVPEPRAVSFGEAGPSPAAIAEIAEPAIAPAPQRRDAERPGPVGVRSPEQKLTALLASVSDLRASLYANGASRASSPAARANPPTEGADPAPAGIREPAMHSPVDAGPLQRLASLGRAGEGAVSVPAEGRPSSGVTGAASVEENRNGASGSALPREARSDVRSEAEIGRLDPTSAEATPPALPRTAPPASRLDAVPVAPMQQVVAQIAATPAETRAIPAAAPGAAPALAAPLGMQPLRVLTIRLQPEELGAVVATMRLRDGSLELRLEADRPEAAELLRRDRHRLAEMLHGAGFLTSAHQVEIVEAKPQAGQTAQPQLQQQMQQPGGQGGLDPRAGGSAEGGGTREQHSARSQDMRGGEQERCRDGADSDARSGIYL
jgi:hypothetical protein